MVPDGPLDGCPERGLWIGRGWLLFCCSHACLSATSSFFSCESDAVITACVASTTGAVRIVADGTVCKKGEAQLQWNQHGPAGPTGATGPAGTAGKAYYTHHSVDPGPSVRLVAGGNTVTHFVLESMDLPAGTYQLNGQASVTFTSYPAGVECQTTVSGAPYSGEDFHGSINGAVTNDPFTFYPQKILVTEGFRTLSSPGKVRLECSAVPVEVERPAGTDLGYISGWLSALRSPQPRPDDYPRRVSESGTAPAPFEVRMSFRRPGSGLVDGPPGAQARAARRAAAGRRPRPRAEPRAPRA